MYFLRARYLNTQTGRFHTQDTYEGRNGEPATLHKYLYVHGNPVMGTDPSGNFALSTLLLPTVFLSGDLAQKTFEFRLKIGIGLTIIKIIYIHRYLIPTIQAFGEARLRILGLSNARVASNDMIKANTYTQLSRRISEYEESCIQLYRQALLATGIGIFGNQAGIIVGGTLLFAAAQSAYEGIEHGIQYVRTATYSRISLDVDYPRSMHSAVFWRSRPDLMIFWATEFAISAIDGQPDKFYLQELSYELEKHGTVRIYL